MKVTYTQGQTTFLVSLVVSFLCFSSPTLAADTSSLPFSSIAGKDTSIQFNDYAGKVMLIDFWASWCGPCRQSFPWMNEMLAKYEDSGLVVIAINLDNEASNAYAFLKDISANFLLGFDPEGKSAEIMNVEAMPMSYLIDREGNIRHRMIGFNTEKKAEHEVYIQALLNEAK